ncbi:MAG: 50S ribosomal protein L2 [bacterium]|nr:50S ribosomal protein L2 [bacterium]
MPIKNYKPTSPGMRSRTGIDYRKSLTTSRPNKSLTKNIKTNVGRNSFGRITVRHKGAGHKKLYRMVDFQLEKLGIPAKIETVEYDPYRSAFISLVLYADGQRRYILSPEGIKVGDQIVTNEKAPLKNGNRLKLKNIPIGQFVHNVEIRPGSGGKLARSAGSHLEVLGSSNGITDLRLPSKELRRVSEECFASIGSVSNPDYNLISYGKAGRSRWKGIRPTVRGTAMNPVDHKYGGGEGVQPRGTKRPKDVYGNITGGKKTRKRKKWSNKLIMKRRPVKREK